MPRSTTQQFGSTFAFLLFGASQPTEEAQAAGFRHPAPLDIRVSCDDSDGSADFDESDAPTFFKDVICRASLHA